MLQLWRLLLIAGLIITVAEPSWGGRAAHAASANAASPNTAGPHATGAHATGTHATGAHATKAHAAKAHAASSNSHVAGKVADKRVVHGLNYHPPYSAIVIDDNSGEVLHDEHADEPRHPASLTKIMTLYLLFEQLEAGTLKLDTPLRVSAFASLQPPTKLGLKPEQTITIDDAIKALVTESANDVAVVVSEAIGGSEAEFAKLMNNKAKALGMMRTTYVNCSGLPADEQITTARDQALLGRAVQEHFPSYYHYFATPSFRYHGLEMQNHNALLGEVEGVDGVKTGYTEASGYNLVASVRRKEKHLVAVVLGGTSKGMRNTRMRELITRYIPLATGHKQSIVRKPSEQEVQPSDASFGNL
jgi:D-alanyl-D-alanine carboxypeptidase